MARGREYQAGQPLRTVAHERMLVVPSVSIGNVPQLSVDLILHTYDFKLVKSLNDEMLCPFAGPLDYVEGDSQPQDIATALQIYKRNDDYIVQLRSPPLPGYKRKFVESLYRQVRDMVAQGTIILGSANAGARLEGAGTDLEITSISSPQPMQDCGFVNEALETLPGSHALISWVYEGDNFSDALRMAQKLVVELGFPPMAFKKPISWSKVYGKGPPLGAEGGLYT